MNYLTGDAVSIEQLNIVANDSQFTLWPTKTNPFLSPKLRKKMPERLSVLVDHITEEKLHALFLKPITNIIDVNALQESIQDFIMHETKNKLEHVLGFLLTCPVIFSCDVAQIFTEALNTRLNFSNGRYGKIHLALHEALVNGLIHGNLQLGSELRQSARDFVEYSRLLNERLNDPAYAQKSVSIWATWNDKKLEIKIRDEGAGYAVAPVMNRKPELKAKSGRGLRLIAGTADSCTIDDYGREITLSFMLDGADYYQLVDDIHGNNTKEETAEDVANLSDCRVLVMEDNLSNQTLISKLLNVVGIEKIDMASDGIEGLNMVVQNRPDLIILDITMPRMNGYEVLHHLKSTPLTQDIPVLIQTASDTRETRDKTFSSGATDFISKPINPLEFFARVKVHLQNRQLIKGLENKLEQLNSELQAAQKVQTAMLPSEEILADVRLRYNLDVAHHFEPSSKLGGDFWQLFPISSTQIAVYLCDFSGHGVAAALNTVRLHTLITQMNKHIGAPSAFLQKINTQLYDLLPRGQFATFFCGIIDIERQTLTYAGAGSPPPFLCSNGKITRLDTRGLPLGIRSRPSYEDHVVDFLPNDTLLLFSDALTEAPNDIGIRLGNDGFEQMALKPMGATSVQEGITHIMNSFFEYAPPPPPDDVTAVLIRFLNDD
ncbi:MAG: SpoIIE family protein phosphatase [Alphaproteobacteria bacterium]|nr:SpoIIE family protein phosphatase [Alphaproteobacteria bacterium]